MSNLPVHLMSKLLLTRDQKKSHREFYEIAKLEFEKVLLKNYKPIEEYKPTGSFVYGPSAMNSLEEKTKQLLQVNTLNI